MRWKRLQRRLVFLLCVCAASTMWAVILLDSSNCRKTSSQSGDGLDTLPSPSRQSKPRLALSHLGKNVTDDVDRLPRTRPEKKKITNNNASSDVTQPWMFPRPWSELEHNAVPNNVFFVWCENRTFTFNDHLSVLSAWKLLEPDTLEIHQGTDIRTDKYNQWFLQLNTTIPALTVVSVQDRPDVCRNPLFYALELLSDRGGVFVNWHTVLVRPIHHLRKQNFTVVLDERGSVSFVVSARKQPGLQHVVEKQSSIEPDVALRLLKETVRYPDVCSAARESLPLSVSTSGTTTGGGVVTCVTLSPRLALTPLDLLGRVLDHQSLVTLRDLFYLELGRDVPGPTEVKDSSLDIPFVVHYAWFGPKELTFSMYLSFLSTIHVAKVHRVFVHSDLYLTGPYWRIIAAHPKVTAVYRETPRRIFGHPVIYSSHPSDVLRADLLDKYGGIYIDWDVLWLKSPEPLLRAGHGAVVNVDHMLYPPFPEVLNLGVFLAGPRSRFVRLWRWELRNYRSEDFYYNALELPYKVYERHPDTVLVEKRLQVMCLHLKCHPIFHPDHNNWMQEQPFDWKTDVYSIHFTYPDPSEFESRASLLNATGTFADIGKFILREAKELDVP